MILDVPHRVSIHNKDIVAMSRHHQIGVKKVNCILHIQTLQTEADEARGDGQGLAVSIGPGMLPCTCT